MIFRLGQESESIRSIQEMLSFLGYVYKEPVGTDGGFAIRKLEPNGKYDEVMESVVVDFQEHMGLIADGVFGPVTLKTLEEEYTKRVLEINSPGITAGFGEEQDAMRELSGIPERFTLARVKADPYSDGYPHMFLRSDVAQAYNNVLDEVHKYGAILTSSGGVRSLDARVTPGRSALSMHYSGRALDLYIYSGMVDPNKDPYVVQRQGDNEYYTVYARCYPGKEQPGNLPQKMKIENAVTYAQRKGGITTNEDYFINLTKIFGDNGFSPIKARKGFELGKSMIFAEWWHFQYERGLIKGVSTFGNELLKLYPRSKVENTSPWQYRDVTFGYGWN